MVLLWSCQRQEHIRSMPGAGACEEHAVVDIEEPHWLLMQET